MAGVASRRSPKACRIFISYKDDIEPDNSLAAFLYESLSERGHEVFKADKSLHSGDRFSEEIIASIESSDYFVVLLSQASTRGGKGWVLVETQLANDSEEARGRPQILSVLVGIKPPLHPRFEALIGHLHHLSRHALDENGRLLDALLAAIAERQPPEPVPAETSVRLGQRVFGPDAPRASLAGTTLVPVAAGEEATLWVTRASRAGSFRVRVQSNGDLHVAIWSRASFRRVEHRPSAFVQVIEHDNNSWCFERHAPDDVVVLTPPAGSGGAVAVSFDAEVVKAAWTVVHRRVTHEEERFLIVMRDT